MLRSTNMTPEAMEKRRSRRVPISLSITGKCLKSALSGRPFEGKTRDISYGGLCVKVDGTNGFEIGQSVKFQTRLYQGDFLMKGEGKVCWIDTPPGAEAHLHLGVKVTHMRRYGLWVERIENEILELA